MVHQLSSRTIKSQENHFTYNRFAILYMYISVIKQESPLKQKLLYVKCYLYCFSKHNCLSKCHIFLLLVVTRTFSQTELNPPVQVKCIDYQQAPASTLQEALKFALALSAWCWIDPMVLSVAALCHSVEGCRRPASSRKRVLWLGCKCTYLGRLDSGSREDHALRKCLISILANARSRF